MFWIDHQHVKQNGVAYIFKESNEKPETSTITEFPNKIIHRARPEKSPLLLLTSESACRFVGSFLSRHALLVTALCEARVTMKPSVNDWEKEP
jgi:hypothetical protein